MCAGTYTLVCRHLACVPQEIKIVVKNSQTYNFNIQHFNYDLQEVKIESKKTEVRSAQIKSSLEGRELEKMQSKSLADILKSIPGVNTLQTGSNVVKPVIQGLHSNRIVLVNNGVRQEGQQWGSEHAPEIDSYLAKKIIVIKGAAGVRYGAEAIGGVIIVEPKPMPDSAGINAEINLAGYTNNREGVSSAYVEGLSKKVPHLSFRLQGTLKKAGNSQTPGYYLDNTGFTENNYASTLAYSTANYGLEIFYSSFYNNIGIYKGSHIGNLSDLANILNGKKQIEKGNFSYNIDRPFQQITHKILSAKWYWQIGEIGKLSSTLAYQYDRRKEYDKHRALNDSLAALNFPQLDFELYTQSAELNFEHKSILGTSGTIGAALQRQSNIQHGRFLIPNFENTTFGIFIFEKRSTKLWEFEAGIRYDNKSQSAYFNNENVISNEFRQFSNISASLGSSYRVNDKTLLSANISSAFRPPSANELYSNGLHHGAAVIEIGDPNLQKEQVINLNTNINYSGEKKFALQANAYYKLFKNFIYQVPAGTQLTISGAFPAFKYVQTQASMLGADGQVNYQLSSKVNGSLKASALIAKDLLKNEYLYQMPAARIEHTLRYLFKDFETLHASYIGINAIRVFRQNLVPSNFDFAPPPPAYNLFGLEAGATLHVVHSHLDISLFVSNLLNTKYRDYLNRFRYYADETGINFGLNIKIPIQIKS